MVSSHDDGHVIYWCSILSIYFLFYMLSIFLLRHKYNYAHAFSYTNISARAVHVHVIYVRYYELTQLEPAEALRYLKTTLAECVNHSNLEQSQEVKQYSITACIICTCMY